MAKRLDKEELQHDPLIDFYARVMDFYYTNKQAVISGSIALVVIVGSLFLYYNYSSSQEEKAQQLLGIAEQYFMNGEYEKALKGDDIELTVGFEQIINNYGNTDAGNLATYYAGVCEYRLGNSEQALSYIQNFDVPYGILGVGPLSFHASVLSDLGRYDESAEMFVNAAEWDKNQATTPLNYYQAAEAFHKAEKLDQAKKYVNLVLDDYSASNVSLKAERLKGLIESNLASTQ